MDKEMVVLQGIAAQIKRVERRQWERRRKCDSLQVPQTLAATIRRPATASGAIHPQAGRPRNSSRASNAGSPSIPLRLLLPKPPAQRCCMQLPSQSSALEPPASPVSTSINPRFSDAHVEYIDNDCVIHNGMQMVDIALEFATQRAAPRLISLP
ncbi:hypothetical protein BX070DRAFT_236160 [Coemansia spiralis]|nr:hypothetical protein BX070DRAFT_236160 [Coemansia spiralis]